MNGLGGKVVLLHSRSNQKVAMPNRILKSTFAPCGHQWLGAPLLRKLAAPRHKESYLVDPASSHMLVSKIKPCMSKYKLFIL